MMKGKLKTLTALLAVLLAGGQAYAIDFRSGGICYRTISDTECEVTYRTAADVDDYSGDIVIPGRVSHNGKTYIVRSIGENAFTRSVDLDEGCLFAGRTALRSVVIPETVTSIGDYAFIGCNELKSVVIPQSIVSIGACAFFCCSSLTAVTLPDVLVSIGNSAFRGCTSLSSVAFPKSAGIGDYAFEECPLVPTYKKGDVSLDGKVSVLDYNKLLRMILTNDTKYDPTDPVRLAADVNGDKVINIADVSSLINILLYVIDDIGVRAQVAMSDD